MKQNFEQRKKDILLKKDKSSKQGWDKKIISLCKKINKNKNYYTTSSCAGRIVLIKSNEKKQPGLFLFKTHSKVSFDELKKELKRIEKTKQKNLIYFKQESCILHVACKDLESAEKLILKAKLAGFKKSGIISNSKRIVVELLSTEKIELPVFKNKILVSDEFLKILIFESNKKLEKSWGKIKKLEKLV